MESVASLVADELQTGLKVVVEGLNGIEDSALLAPKEDDDHSQQPLSSSSTATGKLATKATSPLATSSTSRITSSSPHDSSDDTGSNPSPSSPSPSPLSNGSVAALILLRVLSLGLAFGTSDSHSSSIDCQTLSVLVSGGSASGTSRDSSDSSPPSLSQLESGIEQRTAVSSEKKGNEDGSQSLVNGSSGLKRSVVCDLILPLLRVLNSLGSITVLPERNDSHVNDSSSTSSSSSLSSSTSSRDSPSSHSSSSSSSPSPSQDNKDNKDNDTATTTTTTAEGATPSSQSDTNATTTTTTTTTINDTNDAPGVDEDVQGIDDGDNDDQPQALDSDLTDDLSRIIWTWVPNLNDLAPFISAGMSKALLNGVPEGLSDDLPVTPHAQYGAELLTSVAMDIWTSLPGANHHPRQPPSLSSSSHQNNGVASPTQSLRATDGLGTTTTTVASPSLLSQDSRASSFASYTSVLGPEATVAAGSYLATNSPSTMFTTDQLNDLASPSSPTWALRWILDHLVEASVMLHVAGDYEDATPSTPSPLTTFLSCFITCPNWYALRMVLSGSLVGVNTDLLALAHATTQQPLIRAQLLLLRRYLTVLEQEVEASPAPVAALARLLLEATGGAYEHIWPLSALAIALPPLAGALKPAVSRAVPLALHHTIPYAHNTAINGLFWDDSTQTLYSASGDGTDHITSDNFILTSWKLADHGDRFQRVANFRGHDHEIFCVVSRGNLVISAGRDYTIRVWDSEAAAEQRPRLMMDTGTATNVMMWLDDGRLVTAGEDGKPTIWNLDHRNVDDPDPATPPYFVELGLTDNFAHVSGVVCGAALPFRSPLAPPPPHPDDPTKLTPYFKTHDMTPLFVTGDRAGRIAVWQKFAPLYILGFPVTSMPVSMVVLPLNAHPTHHILVVAHLDGTIRWIALGDNVQVLQQLTVSAPIAKMALTSTGKLVIALITGRIVVLDSDRTTLLTSEEGHSIGPDSSIAGDSACITSILPLPGGSGDMIVIGYMQGHLQIMDLIDLTANPAISSLVHTLPGHETHPDLAADEDLLTLSGIVELSGFNAAKERKLAMAKRWVPRDVLEGLEAGPWHSDQESFSASSYVSSSASYGKGVDDSSYSGSSSSGSSSSSSSGSGSSSYDSGSGSGSTSSSSSSNTSSSGSSYPSAHSDSVPKTITADDEEDDGKEQASKQDTTSALQEATELASRNTQVSLDDSTLDIDPTYEPEDEDDDDDEGEWEEDNDDDAYEEEDYDDYDDDDDNDDEEDDEAEWEHRNRVMEHSQKSMTLKEAAMAEARIVLKVLVLPTVDRTVTLHAKGRITVWDLHMGRPLHTWVHARLTDATTKPGTSLLITAAISGSVRVWCTESGSPLWEFRAPPQYGGAPDLRAWAWTSVEFVGNHILAGTVAGEIVGWPISLGKSSGSGGGTQIPSLRMLALEAIASIRANGGSTSAKLMSRVSDLTMNDHHEWLDAVLSSPLRVLLARDTGSSVPLTPRATGASRPLKTLSVRLPDAEEITVADALQFLSGTALLQDAVSDLDPLQRPQGLVCQMEALDGNRLLAVQLSNASGLRRSMTVTVHRSSPGGPAELKLDDHADPPGSELDVCTGRLFDAHLHQLSDQVARKEATGDAPSKKKTGGLLGSMLALARRRSESLKREHLGLADVVASAAIVPYTDEDGGGDNDGGNQGSETRSSGTTPREKPGQVKLSIWRVARRGGPSSKEGVVATRPLSLESNSSSMLPHVNALPGTYPKVGDKRAFHARVLVGSVDGSLGVWTVNVSKVAQERASGSGPSPETMNGSLVSVPVGGSIRASHYDPTSRTLLVSEGSHWRPYALVPDHRD